MKYVVRVYSKRTQKTSGYHGPYKTKGEALKVAKRLEKAYASNKDVGISIRD